MNARRIAGRLALATAFTVCAPAAVAVDPPVGATVEQPRSFGHVLGDVLVQRVLLTRDGHSVQPATLPVADRVNLYIERRTPHLERDDLDRQWLVIEYQVVNAPRALTAVALPAVSIPSDAGALQVAAWPISIGPLTPTATFDQGALQPLRPDRPVGPHPVEGLERRLKALSAGLAAVLSAWAAWWLWRNRSEAHRLPFARGWQRLRHLDPDSDEAWFALHHAINSTAGRVVHGRTLPRLLEEAPQLRPFESQLQAFFRHSEGRFFAAEASAGPVQPSLRELALVLREAERRHHA